MTIQTMTIDKGATHSGRGKAGRAGLEPRPEDLGAVKLIGLGGTGGIVARYLVTYLASLDVPLRLVLIDGDDFEPRNAERMLFSRDGNKAAVVQEELAGTLGETQLTLTAVEHFVTPENVGQLLHDGDVVLLAVDNHATRKLVAEFCARNLDDVCLISGGNDGVGRDSLGRVVGGTYGNVQVHLRREGRDRTPSLLAYHPEIASPADTLPSEASCSEAIVSVPQILFANLASASAMLNAFYLHVCRALDYAEVCFDIRDGLMRPIELPVPQPGSGDARREAAAKGPSSP
ncbi:MAG: ThiF family adenylyltransferase [Deltaproteobacteria bacterium]|nr:ThiF family adenylyltransferase [Deltaproteobacteria bacterium]MBW2420134.1 ThiF family adenylyltransferase [Deltaproteobacteria bacterium]